MGATNDRPSALDVQHRFKWFILGKHYGTPPTVGMNTNTPPEPNLIDMSDSNLESSESVLDIFNDVNNFETEEEITDQETYDESHQRNEEVIDDNEQDLINLSLRRSNESGKV